MTERPLRRRLILPAAAVMVLTAAVLYWWYEFARPQKVFTESVAALETSDLRALFRGAEILDEYSEFRDHARTIRSGWLLKSGDPRSALDEVSKISPVGALRPPSLAIAGESLYQLGDLATAQTLFRRLSLEYPDDANACRWLAAIYYDMGAMEQAAAELMKVVAIAPDDYRPHHLLGVIHLDVEHFEEAIQHLKNAKQLTPPESKRRTIVTLLTKAMLKQHDYENALNELETIPPTAETIAMKAECQWGLSGQTEDVTRLLHQALERNSDNRRANLLLSQVYVDANKIESAVQVLEPWVGKNPYDPEATYQLALLYQRLGRDEQYTRSMKRSEELRGLYTRLSELNLKAIQSPTDAALRDELSRICEQLGKDKLAAMWKKAAETCRAMDSQAQQAGTDR